ncbi:phosphomannomutase [Fervidobacterium pennivorans DSM 9078]|jgi:phosphoglucomutase/phosphomannomutase|uniref:Phosphomannomutase n=1 Tax=Fervidobacterium pennivorans (strain DSM 9078 / Ven5) TaxID=771875 RepID=H9UCY0_FERPD|nr:phospho-sugar mutase [Fervidobacterium pennivorans]AFG35373.1 phosphomannomutase [Fervidobacterium pennivorans DSM 9078]
MRDYMAEYKKWLESPYVDEKTKEELRAIEGNEEEIKERFLLDLEFGTAGLRGKIGAGTNRMNIYTVSQATQGLADFINSRGAEYAKRGVVIAYDVRRMSREFARITAQVLAANGIQVYLFDDIRPTPVLSFAVRYLGTASGIVITASHNPPEYNGYKVYWEKGSQITDDIAKPIEENIKKITDFGMIKKMDFDEAMSKGLIKIVGSEVDNAYFEKVLSLALCDDIDKNISIVYTPLHGTGGRFVRHVLDKRGFTNYFIVPEQENPDGEFPTVEYPNPEDLRAFNLALEYAKKRDADIILATDPDADRNAVMVKHNGEYVALNGNQTGALLIEYLLSQRKKKGILPRNGIIIKSIVTGDLGKLIAKTYGVETFETLTGFKNICGLENELEGKYSFQFGYEESIGYVTGDFVRDKDGVMMSMIISEMAAYYKKQGKTLIDVLESLYKTYGYYLEDNFSLVYEGLKGMEKIRRIMEVFRKRYPKEIGTLDLVKYIDYLERKVYDANGNVIGEVERHIPASNVLRFFLSDGSWYAIRPSGTEPKLKVYIYTVDKVKEEAKKKLSVIKDAILKIIAEA